MNNVKYFSVALFIP
jgi:hypothetical protein